MCPQTYLKEFQYGSATYTDLWKHLQMVGGVHGCCSGLLGDCFLLLHQAVEQAGVQLPCSVDAIMDRWTLQPGFPVVTIHTRTGTVSQQRFLLEVEVEVDVGAAPPSEFK